MGYLSSAILRLFSHSAPLNHSFICVLLPQVLLRMLPDYYKHVQTQEHTLLTKFFGLHSCTIYKPNKVSAGAHSSMPIDKGELLSVCDLLASSSQAGHTKIRFVIMGNLFNSNVRLHRRFDLKGSSQGRSSEKTAIDESMTLKDLDLDLAFDLHGHHWQTLMRRWGRGRWP